MSTEPTKSTRTYINTSTGTGTGTVERIQKKEKSPGAKKEKKKESNKDLKNSSSHRRSKSSSRHRKGIRSNNSDEDRKVKKTSSSLSRENGIKKKKIYRKTQRTKSRKVHDDDGDSCGSSSSSSDTGSGSASFSDHHKITDLTMGPDVLKVANNKPKTIPLSAMTSQKHPGSPESPSDASIRKSVRKIKFIPKHPPKASTKRNKDVLKTQSEHSTATTSAAIRQTDGFQVTPVSGNISTWEMRQRFKREFPKEPIPSDAILRQLYRSDKIAAYERQERFKQENLGEPVPSDEVLKKLYKTQPGDDTSGNRFAWDHSVAEQTPSTTEKRRSSQQKQIGETIVQSRISKASQSPMKFAIECARPEIPSSSIELLDLAEPNRRRSKDSHEATIELLDDVSNHVSKEDDATKAFIDSFNSLKEEFWADDFHERLPVPAETAGAEEGNFAWSDLNREISDETDKTLKPVEKSEGMARRTAGMERSGQSRSRSREGSGRLKSRERLGRSKSRDIIQRKCRRNGDPDLATQHEDKESFEEDMLVEAQQMSQRMSRPTLDLNSSGHVRSKSHDRSLRSTSIDLDIDSFVGENSFKPKETAERISRRILDLEKSGRGVDERTRQGFDAIHTSEPSRGMRRSNSGSINAPSRDRGGKIDFENHSQSFAIFDAAGAAGFFQEVECNSGLVVDETVKPRIGPSKRERRRARSVDKPKQMHSVNNLDEAGPTNERRMIKSSGQITPRSRPKSTAIASAFATPGRSHLKGNAMAASSWMAEVPGMLIQSTEIELEVGASASISPLTAATRKVITRPAISRRRGTPYM
jgi:hypothetical protein